MFLNRHVLKYILGRKISWHDLAFFDPVMYESLRQLVVDSETKDASLMFTALDMNFCVETCAEEVREKPELLKVKYYEIGILWKYRTNQNQKIAQPGCSKRR